MRDQAREEPTLVQSRPGLPSTSDNPPVSNLPMASPSVRGPASDGTRASFDRVAQKVYPVAHAPAPAPAPAATAAPAGVGYQQYLRTMSPIKETERTRPLSTLHEHNPQEFSLYAPRTTLNAQQTRLFVQSTESRPFGRGQPAAIGGGGLQSSGTPMRCSDELPSIDRRLVVPDIKDLFNANDSNQDKHQNASDRPRSITPGPSQWGNNPQQSPEGLSYKSPQSVLVGIVGAQRQPIPSSPQCLTRSITSHPQNTHSGQQKYREKQDLQQSSKGSLMDCASPNTWCQYMQENGPTRLHFQEAINPSRAFVSGPGKECHPTMNELKCSTPVINGLEREYSKPNLQDYKESSDEEMIVKDRSMAKPILVRPLRITSASSPTTQRTPRKDPVGAVAVKPKQVGKPKATMDTFEQPVKESSSTIHLKSKPVQEQLSCKNEIGIDEHRVTLQSDADLNPKVRSNGTEGDQLIEQCQFEDWISIERMKSIRKVRAWLEGVIGDPNVTAAASDE